MHGNEGGGGQNDHLFRIPEQNIFSSKPGILPWLVISSIQIREARRTQRG
jgi:hypothetical protein